MKRVKRHYMKTRSHGPTGPNALFPQLEQSDAGKYGVESPCKSKSGNHILQDREFFRPLDGNYTLMVGN